MDSPVRPAGAALPVRVGEAVCVVAAAAYMDFGGLAHEVVIMDAFGALAGANVGKYLGQAAMASGIDESCALGVVFAASYRDGRGIAVGVVVKGAIRYAAVGDVRCHLLILALPAPWLAAS